MCTPEELFDAAGSYAEGFYRRFQYGVWRQQERLL